ncbi:HD domain-containing protein [Alphaproteobacteria bacterium]|nr:HD domain-containing protein [Alphaproteobacteria bacterium]
MQHVSFIRMDKGTAEDHAFLNVLEGEFVVALPDRLLAALAGLKGSLAGYQINRLEHSLQSATRAEADGVDIELIVGALIHDLGDDLAPPNHFQLAAIIIRPYVRAEVTRIIEHHGVFQMHYYGDAIRVDKNARDVYREHAWFDSCEQFCRDRDQMAFDPDYPTKPLAHFEPMLRKIFTRLPFDPAIINPAD